MKNNNNSSRTSRGVGISFLFLLAVTLAIIKVRTNPFEQRSIELIEETESKGNLEPNINYVGYVSRSTEQVLEDTEEDDDVDNRKCYEVGVCELCYSGDEGCAMTGRRKKFECITGSGVKIYDYHSCRRTEEEEEWLLTKVQILCVILGVISLRSTRKRKLASASLFEQRFSKGPKKLRRSSSDRNSKSISTDCLEIESGENEPLTGSSDNDPV